MPRPLVPRRIGRPTILHLRALPRANEPPSNREAPASNRRPFDPEGLGRCRASMMRLLSGQEWRSEPSLWVACFAVATDRHEFTRHEFTRHEFARHEFDCVRAHQACVGSGDPMAIRVSRSTSWLQSSDAIPAMRGPARLRFCCGKDRRSARGYGGSVVDDRLRLAMNHQPHVHERESRMRRCQDGNGAQGFR